MSPARKLTIDLNAPTIPQSRRVWRLFPGEGYRFLENVTKEGVAYLDFPGLEFGAGKIAEDKDLLAKLLRSRDLRDELRRRRSVAEALQFADERAHRVRETKRRTTLLRGVINLYEEAKQGDYVVTPDKLSKGQVWIGQFRSNRISTAYVDRYGRIPIPARTVHWFPPFQENSLSSRITHALRTENPFTLLERSAFLEVFSLAHGAYIFGDRHSATIFNDKEDFVDSDAALLGVIAKLAAAAVQAIDEGRPKLGRGSVIDALIRVAPMDYTCTQEVDIHSPGFIRNTSVTVLALVIAAAAATYIYLGRESAQASLASDMANITYVNTGDGSDPMCTAKVSDAVNRILSVTPIDQTWKICESLHAAHERAGLRSSATRKP